MGQRILILVASGPSTPQRCAAPFHIAALLARMGAEVTLFLTGEGVQLDGFDPQAAGVQMLGAP